MTVAASSSRTTIAGVSFSNLVTREDDLGSIFQRTLDAGKAGTLTTRTTAVAGVLTVASGHGIVSPNPIGIFWEGGSQRAIVSSVTATTITFATGVGTDLPVITTPIVVGKQEIHALALTGNNLKALLIDSQNRGYFDMQDSLDASMLARDMPDREGYSWFINTGHTNPLAGDVIARVIIINGGISTMILKIGALSTTD